jgi:transcriptional regulator with XRE-family HTH domain
MESESNAQSGVPRRLVTVNQVVAWNIAWLRREAGLTQEELGDLLGWPQNKVSEAERSWNGKRTREFDAAELVGLSMALNVPLNALFLPPLGDGADAVYLIRPPGQTEDRDMADLLAAVLFADTEDSSAGVTAYRRRLLAAVGNYLGEDWREEVARWLRSIEGPEALRERAFRMRGTGAQLHADGDDLNAWAAVFDKIAGEDA